MDIILKGKLLSIKENCTTKGETICAGQEAEISISPEELLEQITHKQIGELLEKINLPKELIPNQDRIFIKHIKAHLKEGEEVICKICGKTAEEIINPNYFPHPENQKYCKCKEPRVYEELIKGISTKRNYCEYCHKPLLPKEEKIDPLNYSFADNDHRVLGNKINELIRKLNAKQKNLMRILG